MKNIGLVNCLKTFLEVEQNVVCSNYRCQKEDKSLGLGCLGFFGQSGVYYFRQHGTASGYSYRVDFK